MIKSVVLRLTVLSVFVVSFIRIFVNGAAHDQGMIVIDSASER